MNKATVVFYEAMPTEKLRKMLELLEKVENMDELKAYIKRLIEERDVPAAQAARS